MKMMIIIMLAMIIIKILIIIIMMAMTIIMITHIGSVTHCTPAKLQEDRILEPVTGLS